LKGKGKLCNEIILGLQLSERMRITGKKRNNSSDDSLRRCHEIPFMQSQGNRERAGNPTHKKPQEETYPKREGPPMSRV